MSKGTEVAPCQAGSGMPDHWHLPPGTHCSSRRCGLNVRQALFMDEGERAEGGISGDHQVPVRTPPAAAALSQAGWEVQAGWALPLPPPAWPGLPTRAAHGGLQDATGQGSRLQTQR